MDEANRMHPSPNPIRTPVVSVAIGTTRIDATAMSPPDNTAAHRDFAEQVDINTADAGELRGLHRIGPALAARIVAFREQNGWFYGPDDLSRVDGVGLELAYVLDPYINWAIPPREETKDEVWPGALWWSIAALLLATALVYLFRGLLPNIRSGSWTLVWAISAFLLTTASVFCACVSTALAQSSRSVAGAVRHKRITLYFLAASVLMSVNYVLSLAALLALHMPDGSRRLAESPILVIELYSGISWVACCSAVVIAAFEPRYGQSRLLNAVFNGFILLESVRTAAQTWTFRESLLPIGVSCLLALYGAAFVVSGVAILRGYSFLRFFASHLSVAAGEDSTNRWVRWLNRQLPDPEDQKELLDALQRAHPESRWRLVGLGIVSAGLSLLYHTVVAIWEWYVQNGIEGF
ncbi:MAG TPA: helix-hairpin-helix domain-containing protein [Longimicrobium sp.]|nr:helix-hairpin-helix domain-containing protein [Longimicrobium sp.]